METAYHNLIKHFDLEKQENEKLPNYVGGISIENENTIVVHLVRNNPETIEQIKDIADYDNILIKSAKYSYDELYNIKSKISENIQLLRNQDSIDNTGLRSLLDDFIGVGIDDSDNSIMVDIYNLTDEKIEAFKNNICDSEAVKFYNKDARLISESTMALYPGRNIYVRHESSWSTCSMGYRAFRLMADGTYAFGFVTAGHACELGDRVYFAKLDSVDAIIGTVVITQISGSADAAFVAVFTEEFEVETAGYYTDKNGSVAGTKDKLSTTSMFVEVVTGREVVKNGQTTYRTEGKITSSSYDATYKSSDGTQTRYITDCIEADYKSDSGDSGGVVYSMYQEGDSEYLIIGIHAASSSSWLGLVHSATVIKQKNIQDEIGACYY